MTTDLSYEDHWGVSAPTQSRGALLAENRERKTNDFANYDCDPQLRIDVARREVSIGNRVVDLLQTEFDVLRVLFEHAGTTLSRRDILDTIHQGKPYAITDRAIDVQILGLRRKLGPSRRKIVTVRGSGYRWEDEPTDA